MAIGPAGRIANLGTARATPNRPLSNRAANSAVGSARPGIIQITGAIGGKAPAIARIRNSPRAIGFRRTGNRILKPRRVDPTTPIVMIGPIRHAAAPRITLGRTGVRSARGATTYSVKAGRPGRS